jgi:hypothetical protein
MTRRRREVAASLLLALAAAWIARAAIAALIDAGRGDTGHTAREVPLLFGIAGLVLATTAATAAVVIWRRRRG